jgi:zinc ribbon protein
MFCPKCAAQNVDGASFCRVCGVNISLIPQALSGDLQKAQPREDLEYRRGRRSRRGRDETPPSLEKGIVNIFVGIGFLVAALAIMFKFPAGIFWGWTFFFPAFDRLGRGIASIVASRRQSSASFPVSQTQPYLPPPSREGSLPPVQHPVRGTGELVRQPPSVTENTTRHLGAEAPTRHLDSQSDYPK